MLGLLAPTIVAVAAALLLGGSLRGLANGTIRTWPAFVLGFSVELVFYNPPMDSQPWAMAVGPWVWLATRLVFLIALTADGWSPNRALLVAGLGVGLNTLVIALNGGHMPQSHEAAVQVWGNSHIDASRLQNVVPMTAETRLPWLADTLAEPAWLPRANVISLGDILLASGIATWAFTAARRSQSTAAAIRPYEDL